MSKRILKGKVISNKMQHTVVISVTAVRPHPKYQKRIKVTKKYKAHCDGFDLGVGDVVSIEECRPISRDKCWVVKDVIKSTSRGAAGEDQVQPE